MDMNFFFTAFLCETVNMLPYRILSYYPFQKQLRFPRQAVALVVCGSQLLQSFLYAYQAAHGLPVRKLEFTFGIICFAIYFTCIRADRWKVLFLYIFIFCYLMAARGSAYFLVANLFYSPSLTFLSLEGGLFSLGAFIVTAPFMFWFLRRTKERVFQTDAPFFWHTIWLLPAFTVCIVLMFTSDLSVDNVRQPRFLAARMLLILTMFVVYYVLLGALDGIREAAATKERAARQEELIAAWRAQYEQLAEHVEELRRARHDLRQHVAVVNGLLKDGENDTLRKYIEDYRNSLPQEHLPVYCENHAVNTLVSWYADKAKQNGTDMFVRLCLPKQLPINEAEFCALLGNLLANALDGCRVSGIPKPFIAVNGDEENGRIVLTVDNSCGQEPVLKDDKFLSTKHEGFGTGTVSVKTIASQYNGCADFKYKDKVFYVSVLLYGGSGGR
ncbi:MAG: GHKL domain-containing protein [bacterium]|nr:GHKL domain-containing protein [bacterium]